ncbi:MAG: glycosyltransferase [Desulfobacterales bacterium]|nr:glycosyltransferase [Desulfobacterales bacterium]
MHNLQSIVGIIFSKDRPMQLDAVIRSFFHNYSDNDCVKIKVIYKASNSFYENLYEKIKSNFNTIEFIKESNFKRQIISIIGSYRFVLFLVDDNIFVRKFSLIQAVDYLKNEPSVLGFSLRLGKNIKFSYMAEINQTQPFFIKNAKNILKFNWTESEHDFGYPIELSSSIYRVYDIFLLLNVINFNTPNTLESQLNSAISYFKTERYDLCCYEYSVTFCNPINLVQTDWKNKVGNKSEYSSEALAKKYNDGWRINIDNYKGFIPISCHQELPLYFYSINETGKYIANPIISIIIITYNSKEFLPESLNSALNQEVQADEILIIDDGSNDGTEELIKKFSHPSIRYIKKEKNQGIPYVRNIGINESKGNYILWLDADDILQPYTVKKYTDALIKDSSINLIYGNIKCFDHYTGNTIRIWNSIDWSSNPKSMLKALLESSIIPNPGVLIKKEIFKNAGKYCELLPRAEDYEFWVRSAKYLKPKKINDIVCLYRIKSTNLSKGIISDTSVESYIIRSLIYHNSIEEIFYDFDWSKPEKSRVDSYLLIVKALFECNDYYNAKKYLMLIFDAVTNKEVLEFFLKCELFSGNIEALKIFLKQALSNPKLGSQVFTNFMKLMGDYLNSISSTNDALSKNNIDDAYKTITQMVKLYGGTVDSMNLFGKILQKMNHLDKALNIFKIGILCNPNNKYSLREACKITSNHKQRNEIYNIQKRIKTDLFYSNFRDNRKKDEYLVSAIVSTYNAERFIRGCIEDLEAQTISDLLEIIIIDSCSDENEGKIVEELQEKYTNIVYIRTEIQETVYAAWNRGIKISRGKYITNANTDDRHRKDAFEVMVNILESRDDIVLVYADAYITENENETFESFTKAGECQWHDWDRNILLNKGCFIGPQPMWRKKIHKIYGYFDEKMVTSGDYEFWLRISQTFNFFHLKDYLGLYLRFKDSLEHRSQNSKCEENNKIFSIYHKN